jgi:DNA-binding response OmpR family regulator
MVRPTLGDDHQRSAIRRFSQSSGPCTTIIFGCMRILVVEDERRMAELLRQGLTEEGHRVTVASDGLEALSLAQGGGFDLILLDVMLPGIDGLTVVQRLRAMRNAIPILMLTARDSPKDVIEGLDLGADDYLTKPFSFDVLLARVRAVARRGPIPRPVMLQAGDIVMNQSTHEVRRGDVPLDLTRTEYSIHEVLLRNAGRVVTRDSLIESVWGGESEIESNTLDVFVRLLRTKLDTPGLIRTVRGVGYMLRQHAEEIRPEAE